MAEEKEAEKESTPQVEEGAEELFDPLNGADGEDLYYLAEASLKGMQEALQKADVKPEDLQPFLDKILEPTKLDDEEMMLPVDMRGVENEYEGIDELIAELKPIEASKALLKARECFQENKDGLPESERPQPMTAAAWKQILQEANVLLRPLAVSQKETEEDFLENDEDEDLLEADEEELDDDEDPEGDAEEPPAKKAKTD
ncbi:unnamed protein product [Symbiodinium sp. CCMP2592]|nr:unnamed protein product [Symbiodinium sp. CCMP2592]